MTARELRDLDDESLLERVATARTSRGRIGSTSAPTIPATPGMSIHSLTTSGCEK
jgi:hypothetical protein